MVSVRGSAPLLPLGGDGPSGSVALWLAVILPKRMAKCRALAWAGAAQRLQLCLWGAHWD